MSFTNISLEWLKSARRGGGVVNRAGQGDKSLPLALCTSVQTSRLCEL